MKVALGSAILVASYAATLVNFANSLEPITIKGKKFYYSNGNQFFVKGIIYPSFGGPPDFNDALQNVAQCEIDAQQIQALGANTISVQYINITADHAGCIEAFANENIYIILGLDSPVSWLLDEIPPSTHYATNPTWNVTKYTDLAKTFDAIHTYGNILGVWVAFWGVFLGLSSPTAVAPYVKAIVSDIKAYRDYKGYRKVPIGVSDDELLNGYEDYLVCSEPGDYQIETFDFFAITLSCEKDDHPPSPWSNLAAAEYQAFNGPMLMYQWSCSNPYNFTDEELVYADNATLIWSGAILSDWVNNGGNYIGFVNYTNSSGLPQLNASAPASYPTTLPAYDSLQSVWATLNPSGTTLAAYTSLPPTPPCPTAVVAQTFNQQSPLPTLGISVLPSSLLELSPSSTAPRTSDSTASPAPSRGIDTREKIAIAVTIPLAVILAAIGIFLYKKRTVPHNTAGHGEKGPPELSVNPARSELETIKRKPMPNSVKLATDVVELDPAGHVVELGGGERVQELES